MPSIVKEEEERNKMHLSTDVSKKELTKTNTVSKIQNQ